MKIKGVFFIAILLPTFSFAMQQVQPKQQQQQQVQQSSNQPPAAKMPPKAARVKR